MIIDYSNQFDNEIKDLLFELQDYITNIDEEKYNILTEDYKEKYFKKTLEDIQKFSGKMLLYQENNKIIGMIVGIINNEETCGYDFKAPKRGRITELIVSKKCRAKGYGNELLNAMENYLKNRGCKDILLEVFGYNKNAINFYKKNGYHTRVIDMTKKL